MGQLEETPVQIIDSELTQTKEALVLKSKVDSRKVVFHPDEAPYLVLLKSGQTLRHIVQSLRQDLRNFRFHVFFRVLDLLSLHGFIKNDQVFKTFLDEARTPYMWPESAMKDAILSARLIKRFSLGGALWPISIAVSLLLIVYSFFSSFEAFFQSSIDSGFLIVNGNYLKGILLILMVNSLMLSLKGLVRSLLMALSTGWFPELKINVSFIGIFIDCQSTDPLSKPFQQIASLLGLISSFLVLLLVPQVVSLLDLYFVPIEASLQKDIVAFFMLVILAEMSPFVKSDFTKGLMILYNIKWEKINQSFSHWWDRSRDKVIYGVHFLGIVSWLALLGIELIRYLSYVPKDQIEVFKSLNLSGPLSSVVLLVLLVIFFGGLLYEIINSFTYSGPVSGFRRFWLVRQARLGQLEEFELKTDSPSKFLSEIPPFNQLDSKILDQIGKDASFKEYNIGYGLCEQGQDSRDMFVILNGRVGVYRRTGMGRRIKVLELGVGATLGEVGFFKGGLRTADVYALENIRVLKVRYNQEYRNWFLDEAKFQFLQDRMWLMQTLMTSKLFKDIPVEALDLFIKVGEFIDRPPHQIIISEGENPDGFFVIVQGHCLVTQKGDYIRDLHRGDVFGEIGLLLNRTRTASVMTKEPTKLLKISREDFWNILSENVNLGLLLERVAFSRIEQDRRRMLNS